MSNRPKYLLAGLTVGAALVAAVPASAEPGLGCPPH